MLLHLILGVVTWLTFLSCFLQYIRLSTEGDFSGEDDVKPRALPVGPLGAYLLFPYWRSFVLPSENAQPYPYGVGYTFTSTSVTFDWRIVTSDMQSNPANHGLYHFQMIYRVEIPNQVEFVYKGDSDQVHLDGESATIGVQWRKCEIRLCWLERRSDRRSWPLDISLIHPLHSAGGAYQYASSQKHSVKPGMRLLFDTLTGEVDIFTWTRKQNVSPCARMVERNISRDNTELQWCISSWNSLHFCLSTISVFILITALSRKCWNAKRDQLSRYSSRYETLMRSQGSTRLQALKEASIRDR